MVKDNGRELNSFVVLVVIEAIVSKGEDFKVLLAVNKLMQADLSLTIVSQVAEELILLLLAQTALLNPAQKIISTHVLPFPDLFKSIILE